MLEASLMRPGSRQKASQIDGPLPSSAAAPSICAQLVAAPQAKSARKEARPAPSVMTAGMWVSLAFMSFYAWFCAWFCAWKSSARKKGSAAHGTGREARHQAARAEEEGHQQRQHRDRAAGHQRAPLGVVGALHAAQR